MKFSRSSIRRQCRSDIRIWIRFNAAKTRGSPVPRGNAAKRGESVEYSISAGRLLIGFSWSSPSALSTRLTPHSHKEASAISAYIERRARVCGRHCARSCIRCNLDPRCLTLTSRCIGLVATCMLQNLRNHVSSVRAPLPHPVPCSRICSPLRSADHATQSCRSTRARLRGTYVHREM